MIKRHWMLLIAVIAIPIGNAYSTMLARGWALWLFYRL